MVISDLQHLESVETTSIVGGSRRGSYGGYNFAQVTQINVSLFNKGYVYQNNSSYISQR